MYISIPYEFLQVSPLALDGVTPWYAFKMPLRLSPTNNMTTCIHPYQNALTYFMFKSEVTKRLGFRIFNMFCRWRKAHLGTKLRSLSPNFRIRGVVCKLEGLAIGPHTAFSLSSHSFSEFGALLSYNNGMSCSVDMSMLVILLFISTFCHWGWLLAFTLWIC